jgi:hypothetical protein
MKDCGERQKTEKQALPPRSADHIAPGMMPVASLSCQPIRIVDADCMDWGHWPGQVNSGGSGTQRMWAGARSTRARSGRVWEGLGGFGRLWEGAGRCRKMPWVREGVRDSRRPKAEGRGRGDTSSVRWYKWPATLASRISARPARLYLGTCTRYGTMTYETLSNTKLYDIIGNGNGHMDHSH